MGPKVQRTPLKKEAQEEEDLENLHFLRKDQQDVLDQLKVKIDATLVEERTEAAAKVHRWRLDTCFTAFAAIKERIYRADPEKRTEHKMVAVEFEALFDQLAMALGGWNVGAVQPASYENWEKFKVMFVDVVDKANESDRIKLYHLEKALVGEASGFIDAKTIQDGNYTHAWNQLTEHYEDKRRMVDLHIGGLLKVKKLFCQDHLELRALMDSVVGNVENLKYLGQEFTGVSEQFVVYLLGHALDDETRKVWESTVAKGVLPKYDEMIKTLKDRISVLERCDSTNEAAPTQHHRADSKPTNNESYQIANTAITSLPGPKCDFCNERHLTFKCAAFHSLTVCQRMEKVREQCVCFNCLRAGHGAKKCRRKSSCGKCQRRHHTLLHDFYRKSTAPQRPAPAMRRLVEPLPPAKVNDSPTPMLQTAIVDLRNENNRPVPCRILLDCGSQVNLMSTSMANRLNLKRIPAHVPICGIGGKTINTKESVTVQLQSRYSAFTADVECLVVPRVTGRVPASQVNANDWPIPKGVQLADPKFHIPDRIDMLVGASLYFRLLKRGFVHMWDNYPELSETHLGWVVVGGAGISVTCPEFAHAATALERASAGRSPSPGGGCWSPNASRRSATLVNEV
ncbi:uncharacterized protein LOC119769091 [Culex quinquefasciatus]|uniref:uncharacterized protein LOC119769091 n=1 Tax=Culex quinquefasciatus TaxID=7176 RepID=UPI0018E3733B|nr:uncharacterized protein LOC119769091 [Culex quinquefasciatus]